jgi:hypothetical protein
MNIVGNKDTVAGPKHQANEFVEYEADCKEVVRPLLEGILDMTEKAGWRRRTVASALMFLAAQNLNDRSQENGSEQQVSQDVIE